MLYVKSIDPLRTIASYYKDRGCFNSKNNHWFGKCAKELGIEVEVASKDLKLLLTGKLPNRENVVRNDGSNLFDGVGYELLFVAMKNFSMLAKEDSKIFQAHMQAVNATLQYVEKQVTAVIKKEHYFEGYYTRNIVVACFHHLGGVANHYKLHSHCLVFNVTRSHGKYLELEPDLFMTSSHEFGRRYRLEFAKVLTRYGYKLGPVNDDGFFNIEDIQVNKCCWKL
jgi:conjugative relaxase-like TrwC/TraI family protein